MKEKLVLLIFKLSVFFGVDLCRNCGQ